jgi:hypothetical protein
MTAIIREANGFEWRAFVRLFAAALIGLVALLYAFTFALDPFGIRARPGHPPAPLMDINQRYMYPQLIRSGLFDGAIFGTSTARLIDPQKLGPAFGAHAANFAMNAASPWEQVQLADLFLRHVPAPKLMVFGLDHTWCAADITNPEKRLTFRSFPPWLYGESRLAMLPQIFNLKSLEIAGRVLSNRLGLARARMRQDGYGVFTPPESLYNLAQARSHIWEGPPRRIEPEVPPHVLSAAERDALRTPAVEWFDGVVERLPASTRLLVLFPPIHAVVQPVPGSRAAALDEVCKERFAAVALRHGATIVDFRRPTAITTEDSNYWDRMHYRLGIADQIVESIKAAAETGQDAPDGTYRTIANRTGL